MPNFLVRVGLYGQVGRFSSTDSWEYTRGEQVVCRTARGIEVGKVVAATPSPEIAASPAGSHQSDVDIAWDGRVLRRMAPEDQLLWGHLRQMAEDTHASCEQWLAEHKIVATLLDVEPLLDGRTLYFHFLTGVDDEVQQHLDQMVNLYELEVRKSQFAKLVEHGCGPGCGTDQAQNGCATQGCAVCKIAKQCSTSHR